MNPYLECSRPNFWLSGMVLSEDAIKNGTTPEKIRLALEAENIEARPVWKPMHMQPVFAGHDFISVEGGDGVGGDIFARGLCLPSDIKMTEEEQAEVIRIIKEQFNVSQVL